MGEGVVSRRGVVAGVLAASVMMGRTVGAQEDAEPAPPVFGDGIAGGGTLETSTGPVNFTLAAFARDTGDGTAEYIGTFGLQDANDPANLVIMTPEYLSGYAATNEAVPGFRQIVGWANANGSGPFPFIVEVDGEADAAAGEQSVLVLFGDTAATLLGGGVGSVCDCGGYDYRVKGTVVAGGVTLFPIPTAG